MTPPSEAAMERALEIVRRRPADTLTTQAWVIATAIDHAAAMATERAAKIVETSGVHGEVCRSRAGLSCDCAVRTIRPEQYAAAIRAGSGR